MSQIDISMEPDLRAVMLKEVKELLPAFLSAASVERGGPVSAAIDLLNLPESDLHRVLAVHVLLSSPVRELLADLQAGMRRPLTSSVRPRVAGRSVTSGIDWAATARERATSSPIGDVWVTRPASRIFDIPENRALSWVLRILDERGDLALGRSGDEPGEWGQEIRAMLVAVRRARRMAWLEAIPATWPGDEAYFRLGADRMGFYRLRVTEAARYLRRTVLAPSPEQVVQALSERYFEPSQDWKLFEIAVLMRLTAALSNIGFRESRTHLFHDSKKRPFATFRIDGTRKVRLWYQTWPPATHESELNDAVHHYELRSGGTRPDIVVELLHAGTPVRAILLELKASASPSYLSSGFLQLLGYLRDRPALFTDHPSGWLVAPAGPAFVSKDPNGRALWVTSADDVAAAVIETVVANAASVRSGANRAGAAEKA